MELFRQFIKFIERNLTWVQLLTGGSLLTVVGLFSKHLAEQTAWIASHGPYAIWMAALVGAAMFAAVFLALIWARYAWIRGSAMSHWREAVGDRFNPLDANFRSQRILLRDLVSPVNPVIQNKTFYDCELIGPGNVVVRVTQPGRGGFANLHFTDCDWVVARPNVHSRSFIILENCHFIGGSVNNVMFFMIPEEAATMQMLGINWITDPPNLPDGVQALPLQPSTAPETPQ